MKEPQTREIDGREYTVTPTGTMKSIEVLRRIGAILGPSLEKLGAALEGAHKAGGEVDLSKLGGAVGAVFLSLAEGQLAAVTRDGLLVGTTVMENGRKVELLSPKGFDEHFAGDLPRLFKVLAFAFEVQYGNFSAWLGSALAGLGAKTGQAGAKPSTSPST